MQKICEVCGEAFEAKRSDAKYCSKKCRQNKSVRKIRGSFAKKVCRNCGKEIEGNNNVLYCDDCKEWLHELDVYRANDNRFDVLDIVDIEDD